MKNEIIYRDIEKEKLYLRYESVMGKGFFSDMDPMLKQKLYREICDSANPKMAAVKVPVFADGERLELGDISLFSRDLAVSVGDSREAFVFAVTLGHETDRIIERYKKLPQSAARAFCCDKIASELCEVCANIAQDILSTKIKTKKRFSVGYGDLSLSEQPKVLNLLNAEKLLGITLTGGMLMKPSKTITAIVGVDDRK